MWLNEYTNGRMYANSTEWFNGIKFQLCDRYDESCVVQKGQHYIPVKLYPFKENKSSLSINAWKSMLLCLLLQ